MSTKKDLTDLLSYAVKKAEASAEIKVAWNGLSALEKHLAKKAAAKGPVSVANIKKLAALIEKKPVKQAMCGAKHSPKKKKKAMKKASASQQRTVGLLKKAFANPRLVPTLKVAVQSEDFLKMAVHPFGRGPMPTPAPTYGDALKARTIPDFLKKTWNATPGWGRGLAALAAIAGIGVPAVTSLGREVQKRFDTGVDPSLKGYGLDPSLMAGLQEYIAKTTGWTSQMNALQNLMARASRGGETGLGRGIGM